MEVEPPKAESSKCYSKTKMEARSSEEITVVILPSLPSWWRFQTSGISFPRKTNGLDCAMVFVFGTVSYLLWSGLESSNYTRPRPRCLDVEGRVGG